MFLDKLSHRHKICAWLFLFRVLVEYPVSGKVKVNYVQEKNSLYELILYHYNATQIWYSVYCL